MYPCLRAAKTFPTDVIQSLVQRSSDVGVLRSRVCFCFCNKVTFLLLGLKLPLRIFSSLLSSVEWKAYSRSKGVGSTQPLLKDATFVVQVLWKILPSSKNLLPAPFNKFLWKKIVNVSIIVSDEKCAKFFSSPSFVLLKIGQAIFQWWCSINKRW